MNARTRFALASLVVAVAVKASAVAADPPAEKVPAEKPVVVHITATYPGANAKVVAETVAAPIELQVNGVEGLVRIESISDNDGRYVARVLFGPKADATAVLALVQNRVALAEPSLPEAVRRAGVVVKIAAVDVPEKR